MTGTPPPAVVAALELLDHNVWHISSVPGLITVTRRWPDGSVDTLLMIGSTGNAHGRRDDPSGQPVWKLDGPADTVAAALNALETP
jgi:hypothetical protein